MPYLSPQPLQFVAHRLAGRVIIVTGASSGIGAAAVRRFSIEGAKVMATARRADRLIALAADLNKEGLDVAWHACDVTDEASV
jgi:A-factor type gamma-butyrolactone 1'-reductase (1S-forming)